MASSVVGVVLAVGARAPGTAWAQGFEVVARPATMFVNDRLYLLSRKGTPLTHGMNSPEALDLCVRLRLPSDGGCRWDTILEAEERGSDPAARLNGVQIAEGQAAPGHCPGAMLLETHLVDGGETRVFGCRHEWSGRRLTDEAIDRMDAALRRLQATGPKTLAQDQAARAVGSVADMVEREAR